MLQLTICILTSIVYFKCYFHSIYYNHGSNSIPPYCELGNQNLLLKSERVPIAGH